MNAQAPVVTRKWRADTVHRGLRRATLCGRPRVCILAGFLAALGAVLSLHHPAFLVLAAAGGLWLLGDGLFARAAAD